MKENKEKKVVFNEEIDSAISGYTLGITFVGIGIFLLNNLDYFGNKVVSIIILSLFSFIGIIGTFIELGKGKILKGFDDIAIGLFFFIPWLLIYIFGQNILLNIFGFVLLMIGIYGLVGGIIKIMVSLFFENQTSDNKVKNIVISFFKTLPAIASFVLVVCNILKIIYEMKNI